MPVSAISKGNGENEFLGVMRIKGFMIALKFLKFTDLDGRAKPCVPKFGSFCYNHTMKSCNPEYL